MMPDSPTLAPDSRRNSTPCESLEAPSGARTPLRLPRSLCQTSFRPGQLRAEYLLLAFLLGLFVFRSFLPAWRSLNTDFRNYYIAARLYREGSSLLRVYDFTWFQRQKDHAGIGQCLVGFVPDTLLSALPILPFAVLPPLTAKRYWLFCNIVFLAL